MWSADTVRPSPSLFSNWNCVSAKPRGALFIYLLCIGGLHEKWVCFTCQAWNDCCPTALAAVSLAHQSCLIKTNTDFFSAGFLAALVSTSEESYLLIQADTELFNRPLLHHSIAMTLLPWKWWPQAQIFPFRD